MGDETDTYQMFDWAAPYSHHVRIRLDGGLLITEVLPTEGFSIRNYSGDKRVDMYFETFFFRPSPHTIICPGTKPSIPFT